MTKRNQSPRKDAASAEVDATLAVRLARLEELETHFAAAVEQAKLAAMKELAYGASHEINNPLANISTRAQTLLKSETHPERRRALAAIHQQAMRAHEMIADLMLFARPPRLEFTKFDAVELCRKLIVELTPQAVDASVTIELRMPDEAVTIEADATQLSVALRAVLQNSIEWLPVGGRVTFSLAATAESVTFTVRDNGPGVSEEVRQHLFEPFFSGREAGRGLGFGLARTWRIVGQHGGNLCIESQPGQGFALILTLPRLANRTESE